MKSRTNDGEKEQRRVELKYCEHCGGLWVREGGGGVYCERCQSKVADLPIPKKKPGRIMLPVLRRGVVDKFEGGLAGEPRRDSEAAGGVA
jgi:hypothetical protein